MAAPDVTVEVTTQVTQVDVSLAAPVTVELQMAGGQGPQGPQGPQGIQGPAGANGANGQDGNGDLTFTQAFNIATFVDVVHNLGKYPAVTVIDSAGDEVEVSVDHLSSNHLTVSFPVPFSGVVYCN